MTPPFASLTNRVSRLGGSKHRTPFASLTNRVSRLGGSKHRTPFASPTNRLTNRVSRPGARNIAPSERKAA